MPFDKNRNSRDDKSGKRKRISKGDTHFSKPYKKDAEGSASRYNNRKDEKFGNEEKRPGRPYGDRNQGDSRPARRPYSDDSRKPRSFDRPDGDRKFSSDRPKRPYSDRPDGERSSSDRPQRPYSGRPDGDRNYSSDRPQRPYTKPDGERRFSSDRPQRNTDSRPFRSRDTKPGGDRDGFKPKYRKDTDNKWSSVERLKPATRAKKAPKPENEGLIRLNRYIANAGICSRRKADELITAGVVSVNGEVISELGHKIDPAKDVVRYNGETLRREKMVYVLLNKPKDYITTTEDPQERRTVMHLVEKASRERIYPVGRLDRNTTGLLLMTNDGDLADKLSHPKNNITKLYHVELNRSITQGDLNKISFGLELEDGLIKPDSVSYVAGATKREIGIQIHSGKNRIVRRIFEHLGYEVVKLDRVIYANLTKKDLPRGRWRFLEEKEIIQLKHLI